MGILPVLGVLYKCDKWLLFFFFGRKNWFVDKLDEYLTGNIVFFIETFNTLIPTLIFEIFL
jgi:hypothetical protein